MGVGVEMRLDHVQVCCPAGGEDAARAFYAGVLGLAEVPKPEALRVRGGCWFRGEGFEVHVGVEVPFVPARKAHPAFAVADVAAVAEAVTAAGFPLKWDESIPGTRRFHTADGNGNRVEVLAAPGTDSSPR